MTFTNKIKKKGVCQTNSRIGSPSKSLFKKVEQIEKLKWALLQNQLR
jgi:hypothetical protein